jgi:hypothetical protein
MIIVRPIAEPPVIENPEPTFGAVIHKLNDFTVKAEDRVREFNKSIKDQLDGLDTHVTQWINSSIAPIDAHLAIRGAAHGETKDTVGLDKKDNFRTATLAESISYASVNAFVTPAGAKASLDANTADFDPTLYQQNGVFQFASYYYPDDYETVLPATPEPSRYLLSNGRVPILIDGDRLIYSPRSDEGRYSKQSLFVGLPLKGLSRARLSEVTNLAARYTGANWNMTGGDTTDGKVGFFRPLGDKKIYNFASTLPLPAANRNYLLYNNFANAVYKGLGISVALAAGVLRIDHRFFSVNAVTTAPSMTELVNSSYLASFDKMGSASPAPGPANGFHTYNLADFLTLPAGATIAGDPARPDPVTVLVWNSTDFEMYLNVSVGVVVTQGALVSKLVLSFTESIIPGTLVAGGTALFKTIGSRVKDTLDANLLPTAGSSFFTVNNPFDLNNISQSPGVLLNSGLMVKARSSKLAMRVKRYRTDYTSVIDWMLAQRPVADPSDAITEVFAPSRHAPFGPLPERIIPVTHNAAVTQHLVYGLNPGTGLFSWSLLTWNNASIVSTQTGDGVFGVRLPEVRTPMDDIGLIPVSMAVAVNKASAGVGYNALAFTSANRHVGKASVTFANQVLTVGADVEMAVASMLSMQAVMRDLTDRAAVLNPGVDPTLRVPEIQVFAVTGTKALVVVSDGVSYAEAAAARYSVINNIFTLDFKQTNGVALKPITAASGPVAVGNRKSGSGDGTRMDYSDLQIVNIDANTTGFVLTRPFGNNYGDISFTCAGFGGSTFPAFTPVKTNVVRLYPGTQQFDLVDELLPPILIPNKGVFQYDATNGAFTNTMLEVGGVTKVDPFNVNEAGWVRVPAGGRLVIGGKAMVLGEEFALKVNPAGTTYCYLVRYGDVIAVLGSDVRREVANNEVMFGIAVNGVLQQVKDYMVMSNHVVSATRRGSAIPCFVDDGADGPNQFFTHRDVF